MIRINMSVTLPALPILSRFLDIVSKYGSSASIEGVAKSAEAKNEDSIMSLVQAGVTVGRARLRRVDEKGPAIVAARRRGFS